jgi:hypothetical protein
VPPRAARRNGRKAQGSQPDAPRAVRPGGGVQPAAEPLTIYDLGWTREEAARARAQMASFSADWDDPAMDIYNES